MKKIPGLHHQKFSKEKKKPVKKKFDNVKLADYNLAKLANNEDAKGVIYSEERSIKSYLRNRKQQIRSLNKELGYSESDQSEPETSPEPKEESRPTEIRKDDVTQDATLSKSTTRLIGE